MPYVDGSLLQREENLEQTTKTWILATHKCNVVFQWHSNPLFLLTCSCLILPVKDTSLCSYISEFPFAQGLLSNTFDGLKSVNT